MNKLFQIESDNPLFRYFTDAERERIGRIGELRSIEANDFLIRAGDVDATLFAIEDGHLDIVAPNLSIIATVGPSDVLGEVSFLDDFSRATPVRAGEEAVMVRAWDKRCYPRDWLSSRSCWPSSR
jgi:CRP-like cAMP-binding protein